MPTKKNTFKLDIRIALDNAAFDGNARQETARIIYDYVKWLVTNWPITEETNHTHYLDDINGNSVGEARLKFKDSSSESAGQWKEDSNGGVEPGRTND